MTSPPFRGAPYPFNHNNHGVQSPADDENDDDAPAVAPFQMDLGKSVQLGTRTSIDRTFSTGRALDEAIDIYFDALLDITAPLLPVQTLFISFHIMQKRARQFIDDARYFAVQQLVWIVTALLALLIPKSTSSGLLYLSEIFFALVLVMSSLEVILYVVGHGFFAGEKFGRTAKQLRILAVLGVWSPPRFRRKGDLAAQHYQVQTPLLSNPFMRIELLLLVISLIGYMLDSDGFGRVRYVHLLRCARLIYGLANFWPMLIRVIATFQASFSGMSTALVLLLFFFVLFGIAGVDQFSDSLSYRCVLEPTPLPFGTYNRTNICLEGPSLDACLEASPILYCDQGASATSFSAPFVCRGNMVCRNLEAPNYGYTSFDDFFHAALLMLQLTSLTDWSTFLYGLWMSNPQIFVGAFCAVLIIIVSYVVLNFVVATICCAYSENRRSIAGRNKFHSISALNFRFTEFIWWTISIDAQYHLSFPNPSVRHQNRRTPFFYHRNYKVARDVWLLFVVACHASLSSGSSSSHITFLSAVEVINLIVFSLDVVISTVAAGSIGKYLLESTHRFDLLAFVLTIVGITLSIPLSVFRFVLVGHWVSEIPVFKHSRVIQQGIVAAPGTLIASLVMLLLLFVSASVAVQLFSVESGPENDWSDSWQAIVTLFRFVTLDGWSAIMYDAMRSRGAVIGLGFFLPTYIMFGYMIRGLFTSVVVDAFDPNTEEKLQWQQKMFRQAKRQGLLGGDGVSGTTMDVLDVGSPGVPAADPSQQPYDAIETVRKTVVDASFFFFRMNHPLRRRLLQLVTVPSELVVPENLSIPEDSEAASIVEQKGGTPPIEMLLPYKTYGNYFQFVIILFVLGSCVTAADPAKEACTLRGDELKEDYAFTNFVWLDAIIVSVFTIEMVLKMIAHGVIMKGDDRPWYVGPTYFKDSWNVLDFLLLLVMYISFFYPQVSALRLMRILRPLRIIRRFRRMRLLMTGVVSALPGIFVTIVCGAVMLFLFAIVGVAKFRGRMDSCTVPEIGGTLVTTREDCVGMLFGDNGVLLHARWISQDPNFDSVIQGMSYLIQIISLSSWTELLARATSVTNAGLQPKEKAELQNSLYFFIFVILANSFMLNIIVGVVVAAFDEQRGFRYLTLHQRMYKALQEASESTHRIPPPPSTRFPRILHVVRWTGFDLVLNIVVMLNIFVLLSSHTGQSDSFSDAQFYLNTTFTFIFIAEAFLKILALGKHYFYDMWNNIDFFIVVGSLVEFSIQIASSGQAVTITSVGRAFRILRVFRSVRRVPSLQMMFTTLANSTPAILSIFGVMIMVVFMYSVVGMQMLGQMRFQESINMNANFRNFLTAWFTVFRMLTLDGWDLMMRDTTTWVGALCNKDQTGWWYLRSADGQAMPCGVLNDCGSEFNAQLYFFSFYILSAFVFSSVVIAILLDSFRLSSSSTRAAVRQYDLEGFRIAWLESRRALGEQNFYGSHLEKELMSLLFIALFNDNNGLVLNRVDPARHVHPALTSRTRLNFRKIIYELEFVTHRNRELLRKNLRTKMSEKNAKTRATEAMRMSPTSEVATSLPSPGTPQVSTPLQVDNIVPQPDIAACIEAEVNAEHPPGTYAFHDVMECLCRFQMGPDALGLEQKVVREAFEDKMNVALFSTSIKMNLLNRLREARERLKLYDLADAPQQLADAAMSIDDAMEIRRQRSTLSFRQNTEEGRADAWTGVGAQPVESSDRLHGVTPRTETPGKTPEDVVTRSILKKSFYAPSSLRAPVFLDEAVGVQTPCDIFQELGGDVESVDSDDKNGRAKPQEKKSERAIARMAVEKSEKVARAELAVAAVVEQEGLHRFLMELVSTADHQAIVAESKRSWVRLLIALRVSSSLPSAHSSSIRSTPSASASYGGFPEEGMPLRRRAPVESFSSIQSRRNPISALETPAIMCPDDANCPLYGDLRHTKARRHTCRRGAQCHDYSSQHAAHFLHPMPIEVDELSSDDEMMELVV